MSPEALQQRLQILLQQDRYKDARVLLETYLASEPDDAFARVMYTQVLVATGDMKMARQIMEPLLGEHPDNPIVLKLAAEVELAEEKFAIAEGYVRTLLEAEARDADALALMARIKLTSRNYDAALRYADEALSVEPEHQEALNLRIVVASVLGREDVGMTVEDALNLNPEDPSTIANHAYSLLTAGKHTEALDRSRYALSLNPENNLARYVMLEGLKAKNPLYRGYFKYQMAMSRLSGGASYAITIGLYFGVQFLSRTASKNADLAPYLYPIVYLFVGLFLLSWIISPLMNFYLLTNPYGRLLLDKDDKLMAKLVGTALGTSLLCFAAYFLTDASRLLYAGVLSIGLMIPLGSFLNPTGKQQRRIATAATIAIAVVGLAGILLLNGSILMVAGFGLLAYQFLINALMAKEGGRTFGE